MIFDEVTRIINAMELTGREEISTYQANEYFPHLTSREMASILRRDERLENVGKIWYRCRTGYANISIWQVRAVSC